MGSATGGGSSPALGLGLGLLAGTVWVRTTVRAPPATLLALVARGPERLCAALGGVLLPAGGC